MLPPESSPVDLVSREVVVSVGTLERWRAEALADAAADPPPAGAERWTAMARLEAVIATAAMDATSCNAWCREHGLYAADLEAWKRGAFSGPVSVKVVAARVW